MIIMIYVSVCQGDLGFIILQLEQAGKLKKKVADLVSTLSYMYIHVYEDMHVTCN